MELAGKKAAAQIVRHKGEAAMNSNYRVPGIDRPAPDPEDEAGGDPVCWAHLVCPECGAIVSEGHREGCQAPPEPQGSREP